MTEGPRAGGARASPARSSGFGRYRALGRNGRYLRVFSAGLGSSAGSTIAGVAFTWIVAVATGSALDIAALGIASLAASAGFSVFGGTLVDRYDPRRLMILSDGARAVAMLVALVYLDRFGFNLAVVVAVSAAVGAFGTVFNPAENTLIPRIVPSDSVGDANGLIRSTRSVAQFAGAGVGGALIVTVGPLGGVAVNVATFAVSALLLLGMRPVAPPGTSLHVAGRRFAGEIVEGFRWLSRATGFLELTFSATAFNFCSAAVGTFLVFYATDLLHGSALTFALLLAAEVAGSAIGALLVGPTGAARFAGRAWTIPYGIVSGALALLLPLVPVAPVAYAVLFALGGLAGYAGTAWLTAAQILVPVEMQGRYFGIDNLGSVVAIPAAQLAGALLIGAVGLSGTYFWFAVAWFVAGAIFLFPRALWNLGVPSPPAQAP